MRSNTRLVLWVFLAIGAVAALKTAGTRWHAEMENRRVAIILDWDEVRALSDETTTPLLAVLRQYRQAGAWGVAVGEDTLGELQATGRVEILSARPQTNTPTEMVTRLRITDDALRDRVADVLKHKWRIEVDRADSTFAVPAAWPELASLTLGCAPDVLSVLKAAGLQPVPRVTNFSAPSALTMDWAAESIKAQGAGLVIFGGDQVLGYPDLVRATADALSDNGMLFGQVEFGKQKGDAELGSALNGAIVRVHSISPTEMARTSEADAVDRFLRAAQERNIRALYVRALAGEPYPAVNSNTGYVHDIADGLTSMGFALGSPHAYTEYDSKPIERCLMGLGVAAATLLAMMYAWPATGATLTLLLLVAVMDVMVPAVSLGRKLVALQGALVLPVLAFLVLRASLERRRPNAPDVMSVSLLRAAWRSLPLYVCTTCISAIGGLFVVGLLSSRLGSVQIATFSGIKAQQAGAILMVAAAYYLQISSRGGLRAARARVQRNFEEIWAQPLLLGGLVAFILALAILAILLARSGNDPGVGVSPMELSFRAALDKLMGVRPRTKEFLIGHPALLLGIALMSLRRARWGLPLLVIGAIGQVSIVNTFCHLHTPLSVSTLRVFNGLWTGALVALVAAWAVDRRAPSTAAD